MGHNSNQTPDADDAAIIGAIIAMAHGLDVRVTAEGVETKGQMEALRKLGCDEFQGYLCSPALPDNELARWLVEHTKARTGRAAHKFYARRPELTEEKLSSHL